MWLTKLQIAIIEKNPEAIDKLITQMPDFQEVEEMKAAASLIKEALKVVHQLKDETGETLLKLKQHRAFLNSATADKTAKPDITS